MMQRRLFLRGSAPVLGAISAGFITGSGTILAQSSLPTTPRASTILYVFGNALQANSVLRPEDLRQLPEAMQSSFTQTRSVAGSEQKTTVRGVKLPALIERLGLSNAGKANWKTLLITCTATDDYRAIFTWPELINSPAGEGVLVLHERDGQSLVAREGLIALQTTGDFRLGARHVRNLLRIEVSVV
ncbi:MAG: hypothetical protein RL341_34 [Pseudomonadota bacterium]